MNQIPTTVKFRTRDGVDLAGSMATEVIESLRAASADPGPTLRRFMIRTAAMAQMQTGREISGDTCVQLLNDLISAGLIVRV